MPVLLFQIFAAHHQIDIDRLFPLTSGLREILTHIVHQLRLVPAPLEGIEQGHDQSLHTLVPRQEDEEYGLALVEILVVGEGVLVIVVTVATKNEVPVVVVIEATEGVKYSKKLR